MGLYTMHNRIGKHQYAVTNRPRQVSGRHSTEVTTCKNIEVARRLWAPWRDLRGEGQGLTPCPVDQRSGSVVSSPVGFGTIPQHRSLFFADRTIGMILSSVRPSVTLCIVRLKFGVEFESYTIDCIPIGRHFLFTSSDTFAVGCIVSHILPYDVSFRHTTQTQRKTERPSRRNSRV